MRRTSDTDVGGESDGRVLPTKCSNNDGVPSAEGMEGRRPTNVKPIYGQDFVGVWYGFRPKRSEHHARDGLWVGIMRKQVNWVLDAGIRECFGSIDHGWMVRFVEHRVADPRLRRLIRKWLRA